MLVATGVNMREWFWMKSATAGRVPFDMNLSGLSLLVLAPSQVQRYLCFHKHRPPQSGVVSGLEIQYVRNHRSEHQARNHAGKASQRPCQTPHRIDDMSFLSGPSLLRRIVSSARL